MGIIRVPAKITHPFAGGVAMNVWNVRTIGPDGSEEADQVGEALNALEAFYNSVKGMMPSGTSISIGEGMIKDPLGSPTYFPDDPRTIVASAGLGNTPSTLLAVVIGWRTTSASRSGRGRTFVGPLSQSAVQDDGTPSGAALTSIRGAAQSLLAASDDPFGWSLGVLSVKQGLLRDFTGFTVKDRFSYLSSRRD